tara:strand:- start:1338 stop:1832 length:495 start_codon:yes stop_codon:yes gene_type:complete
MPIQPHQQSIINIGVLIILGFFLIRYFSNPKRVQQVPLGIRNSEYDKSYEIIMTNTNKGFNQNGGYFKHVVTQNDISNGYIKINTNSYMLDPNKIKVMTSVCCDPNNKPKMKRVSNDKLSIDRNLLVISPISNSDFDWPSTYTDKRLPEIYVYTLGNSSLKQFA